MDDRREFLKGMIAAAAAASAGTAALVGTVAAEPGTRSPGRKLPFSAEPGTLTSVGFASDLAAIANVDPAQWGMIQAKWEEYLGPLVDSGGFLASAWNCCVAGSLTASGGAT